MEQSPNKLLVEFETRYSDCDWKGGSPVINW